MSKKVKVLIVDDFAFARQLLRQAVEKFSCDVSEAADGAATLKMLTASADDGAPFDLVICDYNMPEMNGLEVFSACRANPKIADIAFVLITAQGDQALVLQALTLGVVDFLRKPLPTSDMQNRLGNIFKKIQPAPPKKTHTA